MTGPLPDPGTRRGVHGVSGSGTGRRDLAWTTFGDGLPAFPRSRYGGEG